ncbi:hypothetical protein L3Q82_003046 [Scortum barcoo]|uniref:Uncharacterized protein n=1 Tax=Scortum barcoo TaxID=214431 RepID=A0ACB8VRD6_9TELE|nr:hypothetical protein L3Q82_003046 [Scortum barcoo]
MLWTCPPCSPDLNPIEHIWDIMSRSIHQRHVAPQTVQELADALVQVWEEIPQETIRHLIRSMPSLLPEGRGGKQFVCSVSGVLHDAGGPFPASGRCRCPWWWGRLRPSPLCSLHHPLQSLLLYRRAAAVPHDMMQEDRTLSTTHL